MIQKKQTKQTYQDILQELNISMIAGVEESKEEQKENLKSCHLEQGKTRKDEIIFKNLKNLFQVENLNFQWKTAKCLIWKNGFFIFHRSSYNPTNAKQEENKDAD